MGIKITALESGKFLIAWDSLKNENPLCRAYQIYLKTAEGDFPLLKVPMKDDGSKKFQALVNGPNQLLGFLKKFPSGEIIFDVAALAANNRRTKTEVIGLYKFKPV